MVVKMRTFLNIHSERVKNYMWKRGIQLSDGSKGKKKSKIFYLCKKAATKKQIRIASSSKEYEELLRENFQTSKVKLPVPRIFIAWTCHLPFLSF